MSSSVASATTQDSGVFNPKYAGSMNPSAKSMFPNYHAEEEAQQTEEEATGKKQRSADCTLTSRSLRDVLTVLALSFHAVFEGLAIGLEDSSSDVWTLFIAIASHKLVIAFVIGLELVIACTPIKLFSLYVVSFALVSPVGVGIGLLLTAGPMQFGASEETHFLIVGILQGISAGTILYVVVFEILQREKSKSVPGLLQLAFVLLGFAAMLCIELFGGHGHAHGHSHDLDHLAAMDHESEHGHHSHEDDDHGHHSHEDDVHGHHSHEDEDHVHHPLLPESHHHGEKEIAAPEESS